jgi:hypothetical protein
VPSTTLEPLATAVAALLRALSVSQGITAYAHDPGFAGLDALPCAVVGIPTVGRVGIDQSESQIGGRDWYVTFPVTLYFDLADATATAKLAIEYVEAFIKSVDTESLQASDGTVLDSRVTRSEPAEIVNTHRPLLAYECDLEIWKLVP